MNEKEWALQLKERIAVQLSGSQDISVKAGKKLPYRYEIRDCGDERKDVIGEPVDYATDILISQTIPRDRWKPRVVVELKFDSFHSHDAITYSQKAASHKSVFPYLRYGIIIGGENKPTLPLRLFRHGMNFDFMLAMCAPAPAEADLIKLGQLLKQEIEASQQLEDILYDSNKQKYALLHRKLVLDHHSE